MGIAIFCQHKKYDVLGWKYVNIGKYDQYIEARTQCTNCGKIIVRKIEGDRCAAFATIYEDKFGI